ncbi:MAG: penicillin-binding transpeptidase domain-containing protein [Polyangiales bacterium]
MLRASAPAAVLSLVLISACSKPSSVDGATSTKPSASTPTTASAASPPTKVTMSVPDTLARPKAIDFGPYVGCFEIRDLTTGRTVKSDDAKCAERLSPCSTFKIAHSLIGLETGVLKDKDTLFKWDGKTNKRAEDNRDHTLELAVHDSTVWYFQELARRVGADKEKEWVAKLGYGNADTSGGLTTFWLESSLAISADEQVDFLEKIYTGKLAVSKASVDVVKAILPLSSRGAREVRGKTGSCEAHDKQPDLGWFVGHVAPDVDGKHESVFAVNVRGAHAFGIAARQTAMRLLHEQGLIAAEMY